MVGRFGDGQAKMNGAIRHEAASDGRHCRLASDFPELPGAR
jgi:hypothetical protein